MLLCYSNSCLLWMVKPFLFVSSWWQHSESLASYEQQDAHEFFISVLDAIHEREGKTMNKSKGTYVLTAIVYLPLYSLYHIILSYASVFCVSSVSTCILSNSYNIKPSLNTFSFCGTFQTSQGFFVKKLSYHLRRK